MVPNIFAIFYISVRMMIAFVAHLFLLSLALASPSPSLTRPQPNGGGFSLELIHRDSPKSPFYNSSKTPSQRLPRQLIQAPIRRDVLGGDYVIKFYLGTPPTEIFTSFDTGSSLTWTQCKPCENCYKQKAPYFDYKASSTFQRVRCKKNDDCRRVMPQATSTTCDTSINLCQYYIRYGDGAYSRGNVSKDTIRVGSTTGQSIIFDSFVWGCAQNNSKDKFSEDETGIFGLGASSAFLKKEGSPLGGRNFSYCLALSAQSTSMLYLGNAAVVSGAGVISTPLILNDNFYRVTLKAISVGNQKFEVNKKFSTQGNAFLDAGTTNTFIPDIELYNSVRSATQKAIPVNPCTSPGGPLCYLLSAVFEPPIITMHFEGGDLKLNSVNTFLPQTTVEKTCFTFLPPYKKTMKYIIIGNSALKNFLVVHDLDGRTLSFKSTDCSK